MDQDEENHAEPRVSVYRFICSASIPTQRDPGVVGYDLASAESVIINPGGKVTVSTGMGFDIPKMHYGYVIKRRYLTIKPYEIEDRIIDNDFYNEVVLTVCNTSEHEDVEIAVGEIIAHIIFPRALTLPVVEVFGQSVTEKDEGGRTAASDRRRPRTKRGKRAKVLCVGDAALAKRAHRAAKKIRSR